MAKILGAVGSVAGGLAIGKEGPFVHAGAGIAAIISQVGAGEGGRGGHSGHHQPGRGQGREGGAGIAAIISQVGGRGGRQGGGGGGSGRGSAPSIPTFTHTYSDSHTAPSHSFTPPLPTPSCTHTLAHTQPHPLISLVPLPTCLLAVCCAVLCCDLGGFGVIPPFLVPEVLER